MPRKYPTSGVVWSLMARPAAAARAVECLQLLHSAEGANYHLVPTTESPYWEEEEEMLLLMDNMHINDKSTPPRTQSE